MASAKYLPTRLTEKGRLLLAKVQGGRGNIQITKFASGSGIYTEDEDYTKQTDLKERQQEFAITSKTIENDDSIVLEVNMTNYLDDETVLENGYKIREMAFFAEDPDDGEICYCIMVGTDDLLMDYMPAYDGIIPVVITNYFHIKVANADQVEITVAGGEKVNSQEGADGLRIYGGKMQYLDSGGSWKDIDTDGSSLTLQNIVNAETEDAVEAGDSLAVAFGKIKKMLESHSLKFGQVLIGQESIELNGNDTLFIVDGNSLESNFNGASYSNMVFSAAAPADAENWGQFSNDSIIDGKLSVSEQADSDTDFFAKITQ